MTDRYDEMIRSDPADAPVAEERRRFLRSLGKWSQAVIGGVLLGGALARSEQAGAWVAAGGYRGTAAGGAAGSWVNRYGGGGWVNRYGGGGGWINGGGGGGGWVNRYGGGGAGWINRY